MHEQTSSFKDVNSTVIILKNPVASIANSQDVLEIQAREKPVSSIQINCVFHYYCGGIAGIPSSLQPHLVKSPGGMGTSAKSLG